jgi:hypothetical protein
MAKKRTKKAVGRKTTTAARRPRPGSRGAKDGPPLVEVVHYTKLGAGLPPAVPGVLRVINYGSNNGRRGRPRSEENPMGIAF